MKNQILYRFPDAQSANRFFNSLTNWAVADVTAKLRGTGDKVLVSYALQQGAGFDATASELDELASRYEGEEVN